MTNILVTGGAGFIGSHLVSKLLELDCNVVVIDNEYSKIRNKWNWNPESSNFKLDVCLYKEIRSLFNDVNYVVHLAAESRIKQESPLDTLINNIVGTATVLQCAYEAKVRRVIFASSAAVYGNKNEGKQVEDAYPDCLNFYAMSKLQGEQLCKLYTKMYNLETVIFRFFNVYGPGAPIFGEDSAVINKFLLQRQQGESLTIVGDGTQQRDFIHVSDIVNAIIAAMKAKKIDKSNIYNVGTGDPITIRELAGSISNSIMHIPNKEFEVKYSCANCSKIKNELKWFPEVNVRDWINNIISSNSFEI